MKVIHVVESFAGGTLEFLRNIINNLNAYEHIIIYGKRNDTPQNFQDLFPAVREFYFWKSVQREIKPLKDLKALIELLFVLKKIRHYDVVHLHSSKAGFLGRFALRLLGYENKVVYTTHGVSFLRKDIGKLKSQVFILLEWLGSKFGGKVIACSKSEMEEFIKNGIDATFIYNGIDCIIDDRDISSERHIIIVGTSGRITTPKNPSLFNQIAFSFVNNKEVLFLWIGDGELRHYLTSPNIKITGWLSREEVLRYLRKIDIYLSTSLWEGLPLSVLEAMCMGKPLILSNCVGNRDLIIRDYNGFLFDTVEEAIAYIKICYEDKNKLQEYGENSKKLFIDRFTIDKMIENYERLYHSIYTLGNS